MQFLWLCSCSYKHKCKHEKIFACKLANDLEEQSRVTDTLEGYRSNKETWLNTAVFAYDLEGVQASVEIRAAAI